MVKKMAQYLDDVVRRSVNNLDLVVGSILMAIAYPNIMIMSLIFGGLYYVNKNKHELRTKQIPKKVMYAVNHYKSDLAEKLHQEGLSEEEIDYYLGSFMDYDRIVEGLKNEIK